MFSTLWRLLGLPPEFLSSEDKVYFFVRQPVSVRYSATDCIGYQRENGKGRSCNGVGTQLLFGGGGT